MEVHYVRQMLRTKSIYNIPLRVTFYARVSSEKDELRKSSSRIKFGHQEAIKKCCPWQQPYIWLSQGQQKTCY